LSETPTSMDGNSKPLSGLELYRQQHGAPELDAKQQKRLEKNQRATERAQKRIANWDNEVRPPRRDRDDDDWGGSSNRGIQEHEKYHPPRRDEENRNGSRYEEPRWDEPKSQPRREENSRNNGSRYDDDPRSQPSRDDRDGPRNPPRRDENWGGSRSEPPRRDAPSGGDSWGGSRSEPPRRDGPPAGGDRWGGRQASPDRDDEPAPQALNPNTLYTSGVGEDDDAREQLLFGNHSNTGINFSKYADITVKCDGVNIPPPIRSFDQIALGNILVGNLKLAKWDVPTPIQQYALPIGFSGRDIMGCAQTGSGKTAAFLFPIIQNILNGPPPIRNGTPSPYALVIVPTRELAQQIHIEAVKFTFKSKIRSIVMYGGQNTQRDQIQAARGGCDILIGTPGRLLDFLAQGIFSLGAVRFLCLDEADRMLDMGFERDMSKIVNQCPPMEKRQTLMFSATFPKEIQTLARAYLKRDFIHIKVGRVGSAVSEITQRFLWVDDMDKFDALIQLLQDHPMKTLIFVKTKVTADTLSQRLTRAGVKCDSIHGDKVQSQREAALAKFRTGKLHVLVATDVAARGLDIPQVGHVINYDMSMATDDYVHRIGRTGRVGHPGLATTLWNSSNNGLKREIVTILQNSGQKN